MASVWRIENRSTFDDLRRRGRRIRKGPLTVIWVPGPASEPPRVAFAISKAVGTAPVRNRVRRRLRALLAELAPDVPPGAYLFRVSPAVVSLTFDEMRSIVSSAIAAIGPPTQTGAAATVDR